MPEPLVETVREFRRLIGLAEDEPFEGDPAADPDRYRQQFGKCPRGFRFDGKQCQKLATPHQLKKTALPGKEKGGPDLKRTGVASPQGAKKAAEPEPDEKATRAGAQAKPGTLDKPEPPKKGGLRRPAAHDNADQWSTAEKNRLKGVFDDVANVDPELHKLLQNQQAKWNKEYVGRALGNAVAHFAKNAAKAQEKQTPQADLGQLEKADKEAQDYWAKDDAEKTKGASPQGKAKTPAAEPASTGGDQAKTKAQGPAFPSTPAKGDQAKTKADKGQLTIAPVSKGEVPKKAAPTGHDLTIAPVSKGKVKRPSWQTEPEPKAEPGKEKSPRKTPSRGRGHPATQPDRTPAPAKKKSSGPVIQEKHKKLVNGLLKTLAFTAASGMLAGFGPLTAVLAGIYASRALKPAFKAFGRGGSDGTAMERAGKAAQKGLHDAMKGGIDKATLGHAIAKKRAQGAAAPKIGKPLPGLIKLKPPKANRPAKVKPLMQPKTKKPKKAAKPKGMFAHLDHNVSELRSLLEDEAVPELIPGGRASGRKPSDFDPYQLALGGAVEMEHTKDPHMAVEIAMDHLDEIPDYYTRLLAMEKEAEGGEED